MNFAPKNLPFLQASCTTDPGAMSTSAAGDSPLDASVPAVMDATTPPWECPRRPILLIYLRLYLFSNTEAAEDVDEYVLAADTFRDRRYGINALTDVLTYEVSRCAVC